MKDARSADHDLIQSISELFLILDGVFNFDNLEIFIDQAPLRAVLKQVE